MAKGGYECLDTQTTLESCGGRSHSLTLLKDSSLMLQLQDAHRSGKAKTATISRT